MRDGTKLAAKLWIPELVEKSNDKAIDAECEKYPAILGEINLCKHPGVVLGHTAMISAQIGKGERGFITQCALTLGAYTLFQNGSNLSILLFTCKLALVASFLNSKFKGIFSLK